MSDNQIVINNGDLITNQETYDTVRGYIVAAQNQVKAAVNSAMVTAYWNIGKQIYEACGENERAEYGKQLMQYLADKLTEEFGKGFTVRNLQMMRQFFLTFPNANALRSELSWTHYRKFLLRGCRTKMRKIHLMRQPLNITLYYFQYLPSYGLYRHSFKSPADIVKCLTTNIQML